LNYFLYRLELFCYEEKFEINDLILGIFENKEKINHVYEDNDDNARFVKTNKLIIILIKIEHFVNLQPIKI